MIFSLTPPHPLSEDAYVHCQIVFKVEKTFSESNRSTDAEQGQMSFRLFLDNVTF